MRIPGEAGTDVGLLQLSAETWGHGDLCLSSRVSPMPGGLRVTGIPPRRCTLAQPVIWAAQVQPRPCPELSHRTGPFPPPCREPGPVISCCVNPKKSPNAPHSAVWAGLSGDSCFWSAWNPPAPEHPSPDHFWVASGFLSPWDSSQGRLGCLTAWPPGS